MSTKITLVSSFVCFGGKQQVWSHDSHELKCKMNFSVYIPPKVTDGVKVPVLFWLSGITCSEQTFIIKSGFQKYAAEEGIIVVGPDTSPRNVVEGEDDLYYFGSGAGFYVDATQDKWKHNYRMYSYVTKELPKVIDDNFPVIKDCRSVFGHSMGGHGALICALKNPGLYKSVSAFSPTANPMVTKWGQTCLSGYLGDNQKVWEEWDATVLVKKYKGPPLHLIVEQGTDDEYVFIKQCVENFVDSCASANLDVDYRLHEGYDHSYYFVSTFIGQHIKHHSRILYNTIY